MPRVLATLATITCALILPAAVYAQASIAGEVRDGSGGVLPGVTVEAASPALIEKVRTAVTDSNGRYRIEDLRPGTYTVTFVSNGTPAKLRVPATAEEILMRISHSPAAVAREMSR